MAEKKENSNDFGILLTDTRTSELRGRQSVRATFKLSGDCIDAISIVARQLGIKQKSLFDHLAEDVDFLKSIAQNIDSLQVGRQDRIQKTFVISRKSLKSLDEISKGYNAPRDALIEFSVQRLLPIIAKEKEKHEKRKALLEEINQHFLQGQRLLKKIGEKIGREDASYDRLEAVMRFYEAARDHIADFVDRGEIIEAFETDTWDR